MIRLEGLRMRAGGFSLAIDDLSVRPGEYVMVLGPTGAGKTILLESVAGLRRPATGRIWFGDRDVTAEPPEKRGAGLVYQDYALFPHLTVEENIAFGLRRRRTVSGAGAGRRAPNGAGDRRVAELAGLLRIDDLLDRYPEGLSGGEKQRVALARALAIEPEVLLLDEPLSALDGQTRRELRDELKRLHERLGTTVMHVTHDLDEALALGDRLAVLIGGELRQEGVPQEAMRSPGDVDVARLFGLVNVFPVAAITGTGPARVRIEGGPEIGCDHVGPGAFAVVRAEELTIVPADAEEADVLEGTITGVRLQSVHASVEVEVPPVLRVHVLRPEIERLGLVVGSRVGVRVPPSAVHLCQGGRDT